VPFIDHNFARDWQELLDHPVDACIREGRVVEDPLAGPSQEIVGQVRQQDQGFLGSQPLFTPSVQLQAPFIGLQLGFDRGAVIVYLGQRCQGVLH
jgi:hypothetical protein